MFGKDKFPVVFNAVFALLFSIVLTLFVKGVAGVLSVETFVVGLMQGFMVNFALEFLIDLPALGGGFLKLLRVKKGPQSPGGLVVFLLPIVAVMAVLMSGILMFWEAGFALGVGFFGFWLPKLPPIFVVAYVTALLFFPISMRLSEALCSREPRAQSEGAAV